MTRWPPLWAARPQRCEGSFGSSGEVTTCVNFLMQVLSQDVDLLHPPQELERHRHKLKRLVQSPNSFFMDVKCQACPQLNLT